MKQRKKTSVVAKSLACILAAALLLSSGSTVFAGKTLAEHINFQEQVKLEDVIYDAHYFTEYLEETKGQFDDVSADTVISLDVNGVASFEGDEPKVQTFEGKDNVLVVSNDNESISWKINVETAGYYIFNFEYFAYDGNSLPVAKRILVDGEELYDELANVKFVRHWVDNEIPRVNNLKDEVRPGQGEKPEWIKTDLYDSLGEYTTPLKIGLTAGEHTITMEHIDQPIAFSSITLKGESKPLSYKEVEKQYKEKGYKSADASFTFQAEYKPNIDYKTDSGVIIDSGSDSTLTPISITSKKFNHIGANSWGTGGQEIQWNFTVEKAGLYQIAPRYKQAYGNGLSSTRQIMIDGAVPFAEFSEYVFTYDEAWHTKPLADKEGNPYLVYLSEGEHTISMRVVMGPLTDVIHKVTDVTSMYSNAIRNITMITGQTPDPNYDYRLERQIPSLLGDLQEIVDLLTECNEQLAAFAIKTTPIENNFTMSIELIERMIDKPTKIPAGLSDLTGSLTNIGSWLTDIKKQCLALDCFNFVSVDEEIVDEKQTFFDTIYALFANLILSYQKDYNAIGQMGTDSSDYKTIDVWVSRGKEMCEMLKDMVDSEFVEQYKIGVNMNLMPSGSFGGGTSPLLLAINAGTEPDLVLGLSSGVVVDYAIRNSLYDFNNFEDFDTVKKDHIEDMFTGVSYHGGTYGIPETMGCSMMFYRTDIFEQLDLKVPETWDEVIDVLLPQLYQYNMQFNYAAGAGTHLYQRDGLYYSETGYTALLDDPLMIEVMDYNAKFYTDYGCPVSSSFFNRFRSGEQPIGIGGLDMYTQLVYAAPELTGKWKMVQMPGTVREDGTIDKTTAPGIGTCTSILSTAEDPEACWEFAKWYHSTKTQSDYARQVESLLGVQGRWFSANMNAFKQLPWSKEELDLLVKIYDNIFIEQVVLGGYMVDRVLSNAQNRMITQGQSAREAMEQAHEEANAELKRKQRMYKINTEGLF